MTCFRRYFNYFQEKRKVFFVNKSWILDKCITAQVYNLNWWVSIENKVSIFKLKFSYYFRIPHRNLHHFYHSPCSSSSNAHPQFLIPSLIMYALFKELSECIQLGFLIIENRMSFVFEDLKLSLLTWLLIIHIYDMRIIWVTAINIFVSFSSFLICFMTDNFRHVYNALASYSSALHSLTSSSSF